MDRLREHPWGIDIPINGALPTYAQLSWLNRGLEVLDGTGVNQGEARRPRAAPERLRVLGAAAGDRARGRAAAAAGPAASSTSSELPYLRRAFADGEFEDDSSPPRRTSGSA